MTRIVTAPPVTGPVPPAVARVPAPTDPPVKTPSIRAADSLSAPSAPCGTVPPMLAFIAPGLPPEIGSIGCTVMQEAMAAAKTLVPDTLLANRQVDSVSVARKELEAGVRENGSANRGKRIDLYARTAKMRTGENWCGFFVGYSYAQSGFKTPENLASLVKARLFYLYRTLKGADPAKATQQADGQTRQFFMLPESPSRTYVRNCKSLFPDYDLEANTFDWSQLPVRAGDTVLFERKAHGSNTGTHVGLVESYDPASGQLTTIEGNVDNKVVHKTYDLTDPAVRRQISGFGRPAPGDFQ